jgi:hypothetical protein
LKGEPFGTIKKKQGGPTKSKQGGNVNNNQGVRNPFERRRPCARNVI